MDGNEIKETRSFSEMTPSVRKKSNVIVRGTNLIFDEIRIARDEENQMKSLDDLDEENGGESNRYFFKCLQKQILQQL